MGDTQSRVAVTIGTKADTAPVDRYAASVDRMRSSLKDLFTNKNAAAAGAAFGGSFAAAGLTVSGMVSRITEAISGSSELASEMAQVERRTGLAGEAFQVLARGAKASSDEIIASFAKYRVKLGDALQGDAGAREAFKKIGVLPEQLAKLSGERQLELLANSLAHLGDKNKEAAAAQDLFGKGYAAIFPVIEKLRTQGYDKLRQSIEQTAGVMSKEQGAALAKAKRNIAELQNKLTIELAPANERLLKMKAAIVKPLADNAGSILSGGQGLGQGMLTGVVLTQLVSRMGPQLNTIGRQSGLAFNKGFGAGVALLPGIIGNTLGGATGSFAALGKNLATPFGAALAAGLGIFLVKELERVALESIERRDEILAGGTGEVNDLRGRLKTASTPAEAAKAAADAAALLEKRRAALVSLEAKEAKLAAEREAITRNPNMAGGAALIGRFLSETEKATIAALRQEIPLLERVAAFANEKGEAIANANAAQLKSADLAFAEAAELEKTKTQREALLDREKQHRYEALADDQSKLDFLIQWRAEEEAAARAKIAATENAELRGDQELELRVRILDFDGKIAALRKGIADDQAAAISAAQQELDGLFDSLNKLIRQGTLDRLDESLRGISLKSAQLEGDYTKTSAEKWAERRAILAEEIMMRAKVIENLKAQRDGMSDPADRQPFNADIRAQEDRIGGLFGAQAQLGPDPTSWVEQTAAALNQLRDSWGTTAQQIAGGFTGTINAGVESFVSNVTQALLVTGDWNQALGNVALSIGTQLVQAIISMGVRWIATQVMMAVAGKALQKAAGLAMKPAAAQAAMAWASPATLATIATMGGAALAAPAFIATSTAITAGLTALMPGFSDGGYTGETGGIVHPREFVFSAPAVEHYGRENLESMHKSIQTPGAAAAGGGQRERKVRAIFVSDDGSARSSMKIDQLKNDPQFRNLVLRIARDGRGEIGIDL